MSGIEEYKINPEHCIENDCENIIKNCRNVIEENTYKDLNFVLNQYIKPLLETFIQSFKEDWEVFQQTETYAYLDSIDNQLSDEFDVLYKKIKIIIHKYRKDINMVITILNLLTNPISKIILPTSMIYSILSMTELLEAKDRLIIIDNYSPINRKRRDRKDTKNIVLHTAETSSKSSTVAAVKPKGKAHFIILNDGEIQRIVSNDKWAPHAGHSVWNGVWGLNDHSIGIEFEGYHNRPPTDKQLLAAKKLIKYLEKIYNLSDKDVITHSMCSYGKKYKNRGRGCAELLNQDKYRNAMGLTEKWDYDPDVLNGSIKVDNAKSREIFKNLFGSNAVDFHKKNKGKKLDDKGHTRLKKSVIITMSKKGEGPYSIIKNKWNSSDTFYFYKDKNNSLKYTSGNKISRKDEYKIFRVGTKIITGYICGGEITKENTAYKYCGAKWDDPETLYLIPVLDDNKNDFILMDGTSIDESDIKKGTIIFYKKR